VGVGGQGSGLVEGVQRTVTLDGDVRFVDLSGGV